MNMFAFVIREKIVKVANHNNYVFLKIIMEPRINLFSFMKTINFTGSKNLGCDALGVRIPKR